ncbi:MAG: DUF2917 domain-containing protein [Burkholderiaceae bacterium]
MEHQTTVFKTLDLPGGTLVPFSSVRGERVRVLSGRVWLTEEGDLNDEFLASGEEVALGGHGLAVIEALTPARVQLVEPQNLSNAVKNAARQAARWLSELWLTPPRRPIAASRDLQLAQALAQFDGSVGLVQRVKVKAGCAGGEQALA